MEKVELEKQYADMLLSIRDFEALYEQIKTEKNKYVVSY